MEMWLRVMRAFPHADAFSRVQHVVRVTLVHSCSAFQQPVERTSISNTAVQRSVTDRSLGFYMLLTRRVVGLYLLLVPGVYGSNSGPGAPAPDPQLQNPVRQLTLHLETAGGNVYRYQLSPSVNAAVLPTQALSEGWGRRFFRDVSAGLAVPLVLYALSEVLAWAKRRCSVREQKSHVRQRIRERKRILRAIYDVEGEIEALEEEEKRRKDETGDLENGQNSQAYQGRKRQLQLKLEDLRYQLRDMYELHNSQSDGGESVSTSAALQEGDESFNEDKRSDHVSLRGPTDGGDAAATRERLRDTQQERASNILDRDSPGAQTKQRRSSRAFSTFAKPSRKNTLDAELPRTRVEVIRQLLHEVPGMAPEEVLRIAEKAAEAR